MNSANLKSRIEELHQELLTDKRRLKEVNRRIEATTLPQLRKTRDYVHFAAKQTAKDVEDKIGKIVTTALKSLSDKEYKFNISFSVRRNTTEADIYLTLPGSETRYYILETVGGGIADIISIALRVAYISLSDLDKIIIMDEPLKFLSSDMQVYAGRLLQRLSEKLGIQFIIITHEQELFEFADNLIEYE